MAHKPERSAAKKLSLSDDVFKASGGFTRGAKGGRSYNVSEQRPYPTDRPKTRK